MTAPKPRRVAKLRSSLEGLRQEAAAARPRLRRLLLAGDDTSGARAAADTAATRIAEITAELAGLEAQQALGRQEAVAADANKIVAETMTTIDARLAALQPPPHPSHSLEN